MITESTRADLSKLAWEARDNAHLHGKTAVGVSVLSTIGNVYLGCNVEHRFRSHDIHAEVNALTSMAAAESASIAQSLVIAAGREFFTPCGGCLDWIFELGSPATEIAFSRSPGIINDIFRADELMPHYPR